jgi:hypothetical protein
VLGLDHVDYTDNELVEAEPLFYAPNRLGNVWVLREYREEYEYGKLVKSPAWINGIKAAWAGMIEVVPLDRTAWRLG